MTRYENLVHIAHLEGIKVYELDLGIDMPCGKCVGNSIIINNRVTDTEKYCVLTEEIGHLKCTVGNITNLKDVKNKKQEIIARRWSYKHVIGLVDILNAYRYGCKDSYELSEYLGVTQEFLIDSFEYYKCKYPEGYEIDNYWINFNNGLEIFERF